MKKTFLLPVMLMCISTLLIAQPPQAFKYQAVVRDSTGQIVTDTKVLVRAGIHDSYGGGPLIYQEIHTPYTNQFGLLNILIGDGESTIGDFNDIQWGVNNKFLEIEIDINSSGTWDSIGTSLLGSVPYALYSESSGDTSIWNQNNDDIYYKNGNVGIGTDTPYVDLDIRSNSPASASKIQIGNSDVSKTLYLYSGNETYDPYISFSGSKALRFAKYDGAFNELMRIDSAGNLGIGTVNPQGEFQVNDALGIIFNGTGLNDLHVDRSGYSEPGETNYIAEVTDVSISPNIIKWSDDNGATWAGNDIAMDIFNIDVGHNVSIGFDAPDGHNNGDRWLWTVSLNPNDIFIVKNGMVGIGTESPDPSAALDIKTTEKGILIPRMTAAEIAVLSNPANGLQAFNLDDNKLYIHILEDHEWKEVQYGSGTISSVASYTIGTGGACANTTVNGTYIEEIALNASNTVTLNVTVASIGNWSISTNTVNGYHFSGSGSFLSAGTKQVTLQGTGTPVMEQTDSFTATASNSGGNCTFDVNVIPTTYTIGTGGSCTNTIVNGYYVEGVFLNSTNTVSLDITVTSIGNWSISTNTVNGYHFSGSGTFLSTGVIQVSLQGTGTPVMAQTDSFTATTAFSNGGTCTFNVNVTLTTYTIGTGGSCANTIVNGSYYPDFPLNASNTVSLEATVTIPGPWSINTNGTNGFTFSGSGTFTSTGTVQVTLNGTGTPTQPATTNFTATANDNNGNCTFSVSVVQPWICGYNITYGGQSYNTVPIGTQCWMAENLNIGTRINGINNQTDNGTIEKYCYDNSTSNCDTYGGLYMWDEMMEYTTTEGTQGICPTGWHLPTDAEWCTLENYVDAGTVSCSATGWRGTDAGGNLKETGTSHWVSPNMGATNSSGFTGLAGGFRNMMPWDEFSSIEYRASFWSSNKSGFEDAWVRELYYDSAQVVREDIYQGNGLSVRCVRD